MAVGEPSATGSLLLLCHRDGIEDLFQATSAAAAATAAGWRVHMVFYFGALEKLLDGRLDAFGDDDPGRRLEDSFEDAGVRLPSGLFATARSSGRLRVMACSASLRLLGRECGPEIDEVVGWPTVLQLLQASDRSLYL